MLSKKSAFAACFGLLALGGAGQALAQSTDGYHAIQVFPVAVDSTSYTQRFSFRNPNPVPAVISPQYFPGTGTSQATAITCPSISIPAGGEALLTSLRTMCPALQAGSQFGYVYVSETSANNAPFSAFSRVSNSLGNGFAVEAFPAHTFTSATSAVTGIRRLAATATSPAYQTNCFIGNLNEVTPAATPVETSVTYSITTAGGAFIGGGVVVVAPGKLTRLLDVFSVAAAGDYNDATILFTEFAADSEAGLMTSCTVQNNSSFDADFRIAKQEAGELSEIAAQDRHVMRDMTYDADILGRAFSIPAGAFSNTHVIYFRHPDNVQCELLDPATNLRPASLAYGLEMRMLDETGAVVAGGDEVAGFGEVYLGDKTDRSGGHNTRYTLEVESSLTGDAGAVRPYRLRCRSGSGHTMGDLIRYNEAIDRF